MMIMADRKSKLMRMTTMSDWSARSTVDASRQHFFVCCVKSRVTAVGRRRCSSFTIRLELTITQSEVVENCVLDSGDMP